MTKRPKLADFELSEKVFCAGGVSAWRVVHFDDGDDPRNTVVLSFSRFGTPWPIGYARLSSSHRRLDIFVTLARDNRGKVVLVLSSPKSSDEVASTAFAALVAPSNPQDFFFDAGWLDRPAGKKRLPLAISRLQMRSTTGYQRAATISSSSQTSFGWLALKRFVAVTGVVMVLVMSVVFVESNIQRPPSAATGMASRQLASSAAPRTAQKKTEHQPLSFTRIVEMLRSAPAQNSATFDADTALDPLIANQVDFKIIDSENLGGWQSLVLSLARQRHSIRLTYQMLNGVWMLTQALPI